MSIATERRLYPRFPVHYDVVCESADSPQHQKLRTIAENASRTGIRIKYSGHINPSNNLRLFIYKNGSANPITCTGKLIWERESQLVYGERSAGLNITKIGWTETEKLITNLDI